MLRATRGSFIWHHRAPLHSCQNALRFFPNTTRRVTLRPQRAIETKCDVQRRADRGSVRYSSSMIESSLPVGCRSRGIHAERAAIDEATRLRNPVIIARCDALIQPLEPCVSTGAEKKSPASPSSSAPESRLVYIGRYDTLNPLICRAVMEGTT